MTDQQRQPVGPYKGLQFPIQQVAGSPWVVVDEVWSGEQWVTGKYGGHYCVDGWLGGPHLLVTCIHYDGDDPNFAFHDPADYPRLPAATVEDANRRHRRAHRLYARRITEYNHKLWRDLEANETIALRRMAIHKQHPWDAGLMLDDIGGFIVPGMPIPPHPYDWIAALLVERLQIRLAKDFATADAIRREITLAADFMIFDHADGTEFIRSP